MMLRDNGIWLPCDPSSDRRLTGFGPSSVKLATEQTNVGDQALSAARVTGKNNKLPQKSKINIGTWNVRGLLSVGKLQILERELMTAEMDICGLSETHWKGKGHFTTAEHRIFVSGSDNASQNGVAIVVNKRMVQYVDSYQTISDRIIKVTIRTKPTNMHLIQVYMPTTDADDKQVEDTYQEIEQLVSATPKKEPLVILGDFNSKVGKSADNNNLQNIIGMYGLGDRNARGERLIQFAIDNNLAITNTMFKQHPRRLSTWTSPDQKTKNQIDYILISGRWRSSVTNVKTRPGMVCGSDHKILVTKFHRKLQAVKLIKTKRYSVPTKEGIMKTMKSVKMPTLKNDVQEMWNDTRTWINEIVKGSCTSGNTKLKSKTWMSNNTINLLEKRRNLVISTTFDKEHKLRNINKEIKNSCRQDKNTHVHEICTELERHSATNESRELFNKVKYLSREFQLRTQIIQDENGRKITDPDGIAEVWRKYCTKLYEDGESSNNINRPNQFEHEPEILKSEVEHALNRLKKNKAPGIDGVAAEILKSIGQPVIDVIHFICNLIWKTGIWPDDWCSSLYIPLYKKGNPADCNNYRMIALIPHACKILLQIINNRLRPYLLPQIAEEQTGFMPGKGTREQIGNVRQLIEKAREFNIEMYLCFIDYSKAFDLVKWQKLWQILKEMGVPDHLILLIRQLYQHNYGLIRINDVTSNRFQAMKGVRQGCVLSPLLFNIYTEYIMRDILDNWQGGVSVGGRKINNLRYADDTLIITSSVEEMEFIMQRLQETSTEFGLKLNPNKTTVMIVDRQNNNQPHVGNIAGFKVVNKYLYLGSLIDNSGSCEGEIRRRIALARTAVTKLTKIWKDTAITKNTKLRLLNSLVFPIATYGAETWTLKKSDTRRIDAFEMWAYRRLLRIPWTAHRTNESVLQELNSQLSLSKKINRCFLTYIGHIARRTDSLQLLIVEGKVEGKRPRGRSPKRWVDQTKDLIGQGLHETVSMAQNRADWHNTIKTATGTS